MIKKGKDAPVHFDEITVVQPTRQSLAADYAEVHEALDKGDLRMALAEWDRLRRVNETWLSLVHLHFSQDTINPQYKSDRNYADELGPVITGYDTAIRRRLLVLDTGPIVTQYGQHALDIWRNEVTTFDAVIAEDLEEESRLEARYTELLASARIEFDGKILNLAGLVPYTESLNRNTRYLATRTRWKFFEKNGDELDEIYSRLVKLRHAMARKLGDTTFTALGYRRMGRLDYGVEEVASYRREIVAHVVPLIGKAIRQRQYENHLDVLYAWDEALVDAAGNPKPEGDGDTLVSKAQPMFNGMDSRLAGFYRQMNDGHFMDLKIRPTKAGGGFCTAFPTFGMPYIFANFNGTHHDIDVFTHEMGHAFQYYQSRSQPTVDYLWPTAEAAEIHSMALEFLSYPKIDIMFGEQAERYRRMHLISALEFLPYGACVDHFQHEIYSNPNASPSERHAIWLNLERLYLPWRKWGDLSYPAKGGRWQAQGHIFSSPFYYIDYALAGCCALQFWVKSQENYQACFDAYVNLCSLGGSAPFTRLIEVAGLKSPFEPGVLKDVVKAAAERLAL